MPENSGEYEPTHAAGHRARALRPTRPAAPGSGAGDSTPPVAPTAPLAEFDGMLLDDATTIPEDDLILDVGDLNASYETGDQGTENMASGAVPARHFAAPARAGAGALTLQRTLIPVMLTIGLILPALAVWLMRLPEESEFASLAAAAPVYLFIGGGVFLALAIVNMIQVRAALRSLHAPASSVD